MPHFGARKTAAMREAINARAAAWPRPLSKTQREALGAMELLERLPYTRSDGSWGGFAERTITSLVDRGLCRIEGRQRPRAMITGKGRKELARG
jgi:hypothetical protein